MSQSVTDITADAVALQERDEFRAQGWIKLIAPAKVNLHLAIGQRRADGYHEAQTVMHALNLHDVVYMRRKPPGDTEPDIPTVRMIQCGDVSVPELSSADNIASKAVHALARETGMEDLGLEIRIEKNIPAQGGLGGGSTNAAAALVGSALLWGLDAHDPAIERAAQSLGSDVAFFLHGGCSYYEGTGEVFVHDLEPSKQAIALVKPEGGVSTAEAYHAFDEQPAYADPETTTRVAEARDASDIAPFNNLAAASERLMPQLAEIRTWLGTQPGIADVLLCGSGSTTFATCDDFSTACKIVAAARKRGLWARATSFGSLRVLAIS